MRIVSFDEFIDLPRPNIDWIIENLIPRPGIIMLVGPPKVGKSFLALDIAIKIARGEDFLGNRTHPNKVLYFQLDTSEMVMRDRGLALRQSGYDTNAPLLGMIHPADAIRPVNATMALGQDYFRKAIKLHDPALVVLDTLRECHQEDENDSTGMKRAMDDLEDLFIGRTLALVHHTSKLPPEITQPNPILASRGSSYITGKVDAYWLLYNNKLTITSRWDEPFTLTATQGINGMFNFPNAISQDEKSAQVKELIDKNPTMDKNELAMIAASKYGISRAMFYRLAQ